MNKPQYLLFVVLFIFTLLISNAPAVAESHWLGYECSGLDTVKGSLELERQDSPFPGLKYFYCGGTQVVGDEGFRKYVIIFCAGESGLNHERDMMRVCVNTALFVDPQDPQDYTSGAQHSNDLCSSIMIRKGQVQNLGSWNSEYSTFENCALRILETKN